MSEFVFNWLINTPVYATPLLLACLGLIVTARAGILNLGAEGMMAVGAFSGVVVVLSGQSLWVAVIVATLAGVSLAAVFGVATVFFRTDQVLTGLITVAMGLGISGVMGHSFTHKPIQGFEAVPMGWLSEIPWLGKIFFEQDLLVYATILITLAVWWWVHRSSIGLRLRAVGEAPSTADSSGINVLRYRFSAVLIGGMLCGLAGGYLSLAAGQVWVEHMVAGRGWIAIALAIFARWRPFPAIIGALIFGGTEAIIPRIQTLGGDTPVYFLLMLPYLLTLIVLIIPFVFVKGWKDDVPAGLLKTYVREERQ